MCLHPPTKKLKDLVVLREGRGRKEKEMNKQTKSPPPKKKFKAYTLLKVSDNVEHTVRLRYAIFFFYIHVLNVCFIILLMKSHLVCNSTPPFYISFVCCLHKEDFFVLY